MFPRPRPFCVSEWIYPAVGVPPSGGGGGPLRAHRLKAELQQRQYIIELPSDSLESRLGTVGPRRLRWRNGSEAYRSLAQPQEGENHADSIRLGGGLGPGRW